MGRILNSYVLTALSLSLEEGKPLRYFPCTSFTSSPKKPSDESRTQNDFKRFMSAVIQHAHGPRCTPATAACFTPCAARTHVFHWYKANEPRNVNTIYSIMNFDLSVYMAPVETCARYKARARIAYYIIRSVVIESTICVHRTLHILTIHNIKTEVNFESIHPSCQPHPSICIQAFRKKWIRHTTVIDGLVAVCGSVKLSQGNKQNQRFMWRALIWQTVSASEMQDQSFPGAQLSKRSRRRASPED